MKRVITVALIAVFALTLLCSCSKGKLVGEWTYSINGYPAAMVFERNGVGSMVTGTLTVPFEWDLEDGRIVTLVDDGDLKQVYDYELDGDTLILTEVDDRSFKKIADPITLKKKDK